MIVSRTEILVGLGMVGLLGVGVWTWSLRRPRFEVIREGDVQAVAVREHRPGGNAPKGYEGLAGLGAGSAPTRLFLRLPASARGKPSAYPYAAPNSDAIVAREILPSGESRILEVERTDWSRDEAMVAIPRDFPPETASIDLQVSAPGARPTRWRLYNLPSGVATYDQSVVRSEQGSGANRVRAKVWRIKPKGKTEPGYGPGFLVGFAAPGFRARANEATEVKYELDDAFAEPDKKPSEPSSTSPYGGAEIISFSTGARYVDAVRTARFRGALQRWHVFDEWVDFGEVRLRPRPRGYGKPTLADAEPDLTASRTATTPSGLRLTLMANPIADSSSYGGDAQSLTFRIVVDEATRRKGLPADFPAARPMVGIDRQGGKGALFSSLDPEPGEEPRNASWGFFRNEVGRSVRMKMRVRRAVLVEEVPFDLRPPVETLPPSSRVTANGMPGGGTYYEGDPATLLPKRF